ncbi:ATP-binding protein [Gracilinema caldarium]|uniref:histidine kinase n=1 Tax=Gracilinema caldarium (strain ATCC 51460 / DSM 7334 / H1) TaxID=744872 RepID=F8F466_GRAC1|nr:ATP-binding protein [Gracilinema caldarium]AEJ20513.1 multi-sensor hybrid histidine kinase [Gracilinema caldarium DSM 7334]
MRLIFFLNVMSCFLYLFLGIFAYFFRRNDRTFRRTPLTLLFIFLSLLFALGTFANGFFISATSALEARLWFLSFSFIWYVAPPLFFIFCLLITGITFKLWFFIFLAPALFITIAQLLHPQAVLLKVVPVALGWHAVYNEGSLWHWVNVGNYTFLGLAAILILFIRGLCQKDELQRKKASIILYSFIPTFLGTYITGFLLRYAGFENLPPMLPIFLSFLVAGLAWAQFRYDLLSFTSREVSERILQTVYDVVMLCNPDGSIIDCNVSSFHEDLRGKSISILIPEANPPQVWLQNHAYTSETHTFEVSFYFSSTRISPASMIIRKLFAGQSLSGYIIIAHDLSAEKNLTMEVDRRLAVTASLRSIEANFVRAFHVSPAGMLIIETDTQVVLDINRSASAMLQIPPSELVGSKITQLGLSMDEQAFTVFHNALIANQTTTTQQVLIMRRNGTKLYCLVSASPFTYMEKKAALVILLDITEIEQLRSELERSQKLESIGILAGGIAHDFNNIMTAILGNISLVKLSLSETDEIYDAINRAEIACFRARDLSRQLLTFAKGGEPSPIPTDVPKLVREALRLSAAGSSVAASITIEDAIPYAYIDSGQIIQCFNNIILNAIQAMSKGGVLSIRIRKELVNDPNKLKIQDKYFPLLPSSGEYVVVEFKDSGPGIPASLLEKIFDPYVSTKQSGSGLGLAITYSILKRHGGAIAVQSEEGHGAIFTIYLPPAEEAEEQAPFSRIQFAKGKILVMDDEYAVRMVVERMLRRLGYEPTVTANGESALEQFKKAHHEQRPFCAVILDLTVVSGLGGIETAQRIRKIDPDVPLFVSSGYADAPVMSEYRSYGFTGVIPKPYGIEELSQRLASILRPDSSLP